MEQNNSSRSDRESGNKKWYKERRLVVLVGLLVVLMIALVTALCLQMTFSSLKNDDGEMCLTEECIRTAARIIEGMDRSVAPCEDFYKFACSGWISRHPIPASNQEWSPFAILNKESLQNLRILLEEPDQDDDLRSLKLARALYETCMDTESVGESQLTPIFEMLSRLGLSRELLLFDNSKNDTEFDLDLSRIAGVARRYLDVDFFTMLSIEVDSTFDLKKLYLQIEQGSPGISEHYFIDPEKFESKLMKYKHYIKEMMELAGITSENSASFADEILEFSAKMAKIMVRPEESANSSLVTVSELQTLTDVSALRWNWTEYLVAVLENTDVILETDVDKVLIKDLEYLQKLPQLLKTTSRVTIARFVWWSVYSTVAPQIFEEYWELKWKLEPNMDVKSPRWERCVLHADSHFPLVLANIYTQRHISDQTREKAIEMFLGMRAAFDEILSELEWLNVRARAVLRKKLNAIKSIVGFPQWTTDHEKLDKFYEGADVIPGEKFGTFLNLTDVHVKRDLNSLRGKSCEDDWLPFSWEGTYNTACHSALTAGTVLQPPFYNNGLESIDYGALGFVMASKIIFGFDTLGVFYDEDGKHYQGKSNNSESAGYFIKKLKCMIKQYSSYHLPELGENITINGMRTLDVNMADNAGIRVAYRAYQRLQSRGLKKQALPGLSDYTQDQLVFLSFAQTLCGKYSNEQILMQNLLYDMISPNRFRVIGSLSNNEEFSKAWNCPIESPMNPSHKCVIW